jgi:hypothetical protein
MTRLVRDTLSPLIITAPHNPVEPPPTQVTQTAPPAVTEPPTRNSDLALGVVQSLIPSLLAQMEELMDRKVTPLITPLSDAVSGLTAWLTAVEDLRRPIIDDADHMNMSPEEEAAYEDFVAYTEAAAFAADTDLGMVTARIRVLWCTLYEVPFPPNLALGPDFDSMLAALDEQWQAFCLDQRLDPQETLRTFSRCSTVVFDDFKRALVCNMHTFTHGDFCCRIEWWRLFPVSPPPAALPPPS